MANRFAHLTSPPPPLILCLTPVPPWEQGPQDRLAFESKLFHPQAFVFLGKSLLSDPVSPDEKWEYSTYPKTSLEWKPMK